MVSLEEFRTSIGIAVAMFLDENVLHGPAREDAATEICDTILYYAEEASGG